MIAYAESSAMLTWPLGEPEEAAIRQTLTVVSLDERIRMNAVALGFLVAP